MAEGGYGIEFELERTEGGYKEERDRGELRGVEFGGGSIWGRAE